jgi:mono/diheme cytochrome c family protein
MATLRRVLIAAVAVAAVIAIGCIALAWHPAMDPLAAIPRMDHARVERGAQLAAIGDCAICHTRDGGTPYAGGRALPTPFGTIYATNITPDAPTGIGGWSEAAFVRAMRDGIDRAGDHLYPAFPYDHFTHATDADLGDLYAFLMTRQRVVETAPANRLGFPLNIRSIIAVWNLLFLRHGEIADDPKHDAEWNRGAYLVESLGHCGACHTPRNFLGAEDKSRAYEGGESEGWNAPALTASSSPAPLPWTADQLVAFLSNGLADQHAASAGPMGPVSHDLSQVDPADVRAIATYIASMAGTDDPAAMRRVTARAVAAQAAPDPGVPATPGAVIFAGVCAGCHGAGAPMMLNGRPSLALGSSVAADDPRNAIQTVLHGLRPQDGEHGPWMPGFAETLTDAQVADVLLYLRTRFSDRPAWTHLTDAVARIRKDPGS